jgi:hypothetical protein
MEMSVLMKRLRRWFGGWIKSTLPYRELQEHCKDLGDANAAMAGSNTAIYAQWIAMSDERAAERDRQTVELLKACVDYENAEALVNLLRTDLAVARRIISEQEHYLSKKKNAAKPKLTVMLPPAATAAILGTPKKEKQ